MNTYLLGNDVLGEIVGEVLGDEPVPNEYQIQDTVRRMNSIKVMSVGMAKSMLSGGQKVINGAIASAAKKPDVLAFVFFPVAIAQMTEMMINGTTLPRAKNRENVYWTLDWHEKKLATYKNKDEIYPHSEDLKKWVTEAYIESNVVDIGNKYTEKVRNQMWSDIAQNIIDLPLNIRNKVSEGISWFTGIPLWAWALIGLTAVGVVGFAVLKIAMVTAPVAASAYFGKR